MKHLFSASKIENPSEGLKRSGLRRQEAEEWRLKDRKPIRGIETVVPAASPPPLRRLKDRKPIRGIETCSSWFPLRSAPRLKDRKPIRGIETSEISESQPQGVAASKIENPSEGLKPVECERCERRERASKIENPSEGLKHPRSGSFRITPLPQRSKTHPRD